MTGAWLEYEEDVIESRADLRNRLGAVLDEGELTDERREEVMNALLIGERPVRDVMVPADGVVSLSTERSTAENLQRMEEHPRTRYPLVGDELSDFRDVVYFPVLAGYRGELAAGDVDFTEVTAPPMTLSPDVDGSDAIDQFQAANQELALVFEDGDVVGMVTVTDLLEAVTGEVEDPLDREEITARD